MTPVVSFLIMNCVSQTISREFWITYFNFLSLRNYVFQQIAFINSQIKLFPTNPFHASAFLPMLISSNSGSSWFLSSTTSLHDKLSLHAGHVPRVGISAAPFLGDWLMNCRARHRRCRNAPQNGHTNQFRCEKCGAALFTQSTHRSGTSPAAGAGAAVPRIGRSSSFPRYTLWFSLIFGSDFSIWRTSGHVTQTRSERRTHGLELSISLKMRMWVLYLRGPPWVWKMRFQSTCLRLLDSVGCCQVHSKRRACLRVEKP